MYILAIAEKPSVAKSLAAWLEKKFGHKARPVGRSHIEVGPYVVSWLYGHVLENAAPHDYDPAYKKWAMRDLPIVPQKWKLLPKKDAADQIRALKGLLKDAKEVIGLGDPDQEGQLLQDEFLRWAGSKVPVRRLWLAATDDASVAKAWDAMRPNADYEGYYWAGLARSHVDWLFGINGSRACTLSSQANGGNATLTLGRVQTPTLALVVEREKQIRAFKPVDYYVPFISLATVPAFSARWAPDKEKDARLDDEGRLLDKKVAQTIIDSCKAKGIALVTAVKATRGKEQAPLTFSLSSLQEYMSKAYGMGVQDTLKHAQSLYEKKVASYPRTDCEYLPESQHAEAADIVAGMPGLPELAGAAKKADLSLKSRAFSDKAMKDSAHHGIVPRPAAVPQILSLSREEKLVWIVIARRYLLQFFPVAEFLQTEIELECAKEPFKVTGKVYSLRGWKDAFVAESEEDDDASPTLPSVKKGDELKLDDVGFESSTTKPPKRFTEGTLVAAMKAIHKYVADPKLKAILRENVGIGTEATRANIIGELFNRKFLEVVKKDLKPTALGEQLINALPTQISAPDMTAVWQQSLDDIRKSGKAGYDKFMAEQEDWLRKLIGDVPGWFKDVSLSSGSKPAKSSGFAVKETTHSCPKCAGELKHIKGKFGWFFGCQNEECKATFADVAGAPIEKAKAPASGTVAGVSSGETCPKCKKGTMQLRVCGPTSKTPGKQFLSCSNYFSKGKAQCSHSIWPE